MKDSSEKPETGPTSGGKRLAFTVIAIILAFVLVEGSLQLVHSMMNPGEAYEQDPRLSLPAFADKVWAKDLFREFYEIKRHYEPFVEWRQYEYHGQYINIDSLGFRQNWNGELTGKEIKDTILVFGGSTVWGSLARDDATIPSYLSKLLSERGSQYIVQNCAETGYTFRQEVIQLILFLAEGRRPRHVVFYDGVNDVYGSYQAGHVSVIQNVEIINERLRQKPPLTRARVGLFEFLSQDVMTFKAARRVYLLAFPEPVYTEKGHEYSDEDLASLSVGIADYYLETVSLLQNLSEIYGFSYTCFWQPVIFHEENLVTAEISVDKRSDDKSLGKLFEATLRNLKGRPVPHFYDLSGALAGRTEPLYIDFCHLAEEGNKIAATAIWHVLEREGVFDE